MSDDPDILCRPSIRDDILSSVAMLDRMAVSLAQIKTNYQHVYEALQHSQELILAFSDLADEKYATMIKRQISQNEEALIQSTY